MRRELAFSRGEEAMNEDSISLPVWCEVVLAAAYLEAEERMHAVRSCLAPRYAKLARQFEESVLALPRDSARARCSGILAASGLTAYAAWLLAVDSEGGES